MPATRLDNATKSCHQAATPWSCLHMVHTAHTFTPPAPLLLLLSLLLPPPPLLLPLLLLPLALLAAPLLICFLLLPALCSIRFPLLPLCFQLPVQPLPPLLLPALVSLEAVTRAVMPWQRNTNGSLNSSCRVLAQR